MLQSKIESTSSDSLAKHTPNFRIISVVVLASDTFLLPQNLPDELTLSEKFQC